MIIMVVSNCIQLLDKVELMEIVKFASFGKINRNFGRLILQIQLTVIVVK